MSYEIELVDLAEQPAAVVRGGVRHSEIGDFLGKAFGDVLAVLGEQGMTPAGPPFARYRPTETGFDIETGFPCKTPVAPKGRVEAGTLPGTRAARVLHKGDYAAVAGAYRAAESWIIDNGYAPAGEPWECYLDDPEVAEPRTLVFYPCTEAHAG